EGRPTAISNGPVRNRWGSEMRQVDRINKLSRLALARSTEGRRLRRRLGAAAALGTLLGGLLSAIGLAVVVFAFVVVVCAAIGGAALTALFLTYAPQLRGRRDALIRQTRTRGRSVGALTLRLSEVLLAWLRVSSG